MGIRASKPAPAPGKEPLALAAAPSDITKADVRSNKKRSRSNLTVSTTSSKRTKHEVASSGTSETRGAARWPVEADKDNLEPVALASCARAA